MDKPREGIAKQKMIKRTILGVVALGVVGSMSYVLGNLKPAAPTVEAATLWPDTVKRGPMLRQVRGLGTLVPEEVLQVPAISEGRVEKRHFLPGVKVTPDTVLLELTNPELQLSMVDAEWQLKSGEATYTDLKVRLESQRLEQKAKAAQVKSEFTQAKLKSDREAELAKSGLSADITVKLARATADELGERYQVEQQRLANMGEMIEAQLQGQKVEIEKRRAAFNLKKQQVDQLKVRAGTVGVLQTVSVEIGQKVAAGTILAKVVQPWKLKAELKIAETQAKDILIGQPAQIDTRNGIVNGSVMRIDPAVVNGTVTVDVRIEGTLPPGARPDLSVDGTIELEKLSDVLYVGRPVFGQQNSTVGLFKMTPDGKEANRVQVQFGRSSVNQIEIVKGLAVGDKVILSDMSNWDAHQRIRLN
ncbi:MAG: HlyD family efflux transporter periplasmic adaptor subunit [Bryobacteraceae bacterium]|nr:HlyD family efflux transporter periplasmic adaptor subunit [Bryobacteraceae bacterium]